MRCVMWICVYIFSLGVAYGTITCNDERFPSLPHSGTRETAV